MVFFIFYFYFLLILENSVWMFCHKILLYFTYIMLVIIFIPLHYMPHPKNSMKSCVLKFHSPRYKGWDSINETDVSLFMFRCESQPCPDISQLENVFKILFFYLFLDFHTRIQCILIISIPSLPLHFSTSQHIPFPTSCLLHFVKDLLSSFSVTHVPENDQASMCTWVNLSMATLLK